MSTPMESRAPTPSFFAAMLPIAGVVSVAFLVTGLALPVLPLHIRQDLQFGPIVVGLVAGAQFAAALLSRFPSGNYADLRGAKQATLAGLALACMAGVLYLLSLLVLDRPTLSVAVLLVGRGVLGGAESFMVMGAMSWGLVRIGPASTGKIMAWVGMAMYVAFAVGAPLGTVLYTTYGFKAIALATMIIPLATLLLIVRIPHIPPLAKERPRFGKVVSAVWLPGVGLAFGSAGFAALTTFIVLLFAQHGWSHAWLGVTVFATAFALGRVFLGHLPDRMGGARVAVASLLVEAGGLALIWVAASSMTALAGATLTGFGYTLVYPGFGVEAVRGVPVENRGLATGAYTAFLDLALGFGNPALGLVASRAGIASVFLASAFAVLFAVAIALRLKQRTSARNN